MAKPNSRSEGISIHDEITRIKVERILASAADLFYEQGYAQAKMSDIASTMGVTKPFVYYHFASKAEILEEICERATSSALESVQSSRDASLGPTRRFELFVRSFTIAVLQHQKYVQIYFREELSLSKKTASKIHRMRREISTILRAIINDGIESGEFEIRDPALCTLMVEGMSSYAFAWYRDHGRLTPAEIAEEILDMALRIVRKA